MAELEAYRSSTSVSSSILSALAYKLGRTPEQQRLEAAEVRLIEDHLRAQGAALAMDTIALYEKVEKLPDGTFKDLMKRAIEKHADRLAG